MYDENALNFLFLYAIKPSKTGKIQSFGGGLNTYGA
jgi:hypothetical protein